MQSPLSWMYKQLNYEGINPQLAKQFIGAIEISFELDSILQGKQIPVSK